MFLDSPVRRSDQASLCLSLGWTRNLQRSADYRPDQARPVGGALIWRVAPQPASAAVPSVTRLRAA